MPLSRSSLYSQGEHGEPCCMQSPKAEFTEQHTDPDHIQRTTCDFLRFSILHARKNTSLWVSKVTWTTIKAQSSADMNYCANNYLYSIQGQIQDGTLLGGKASCFLPHHVILQHHPDEEWMVAFSERCSEDRLKHSGAACHSKTTYTCFSIQLQQPHFKSLQYTATRLSTALFTKYSIL